MSVIDKNEFSRCVGSIAEYLRLTESEVWMVYNSGYDFMVVMTALGKYQHRIVLECSEVDVTKEVVKLMYEFRSVYERNNT